MRTIVRTLLASLLTLAALASSGSAAHCSDYNTSEPEVSANGFYLDNDLCQIECLFSIWAYQETNGIPGLQRGDEVKDDTCHGMIDSDSLAFF